METELFSVIRDGLKINGIVYKSEAISGGIAGNDKSPAIIISHGFQCNFSQFEYYGKRFSQYGFNVFCFNFCGGSSRDEFDHKSDGDSRDMCISSEIEDLLTVFEYVKSQDYVDADNIYLMGESQGAFVSGLVAARLQNQIKKLIMVFPAVCIPDHARRGILGGANYDPKNPPEEMELPLTTIGRKFHEDVVGMDAYSELAKYHGETLIIQGDDDDIVVPQYQYIVKDTFDRNDVKTKNNNTNMQSHHRCRLQMVRNMGHMVGEVYRESVVDSIIQFVEDREEIMNFRIICTNVESLDDNDKLDTAELTDDEKLVHGQDVYFTGYCESGLFTGCIVSGVDHQAYKGSECVKMQAEYTFTGVDCQGQKCEMKVVNRKVGSQWKPSIQADSEAISWLNDADLYAVVENGNLGPTIRIYK